MTRCIRLYITGMKALAAPLAAALLVLAAPARAEDVTVFAAASLKEGLDAVLRPFRSSRNARIAVSYAGSNALARQIEAGAPATLFIGADADWADYLEGRGLTVAGSRRDLLGNALVLIAPAASKALVKLEPGVDLARALGSGRLAIANPSAVPAGRYAKAALTALGAWGAVERRIAPTHSVRGALALVSRGEAPLGIVYATDARADKSVRIVDVFPESSHPPIVYPMVRLKGSGAATGELAAYLAGPDARIKWRGFGFRVPPP